MTKKILFLSLGTGVKRNAEKPNDESSAKERKSYENEQKKLTQEEKDFGYHFTEYRIGDSPYEKKTPFVAIPIIDSYEPDEIIFLGTIRSRWDILYKYIAERAGEYKEEVFSELNQYAKDENKEKYGVNADKNTIKDAECKIESRICQLKGSVWYPNRNGQVESLPKVHIWLTQYGIDGEQLVSNYSVLQRLETEILEVGDKDIKYNLAMDVTHSFRSLPLYNLVLLNYIKNITQYNISISHIYYGMYETVGELGCAPIVDLRDVADLLDLTNGVAEFKDTGNAITLLNTMNTGVEKIDDRELEGALREFNLAVQFNFFEKIKGALERLCEIVQQETGDRRNDDLRKMIRIVLANKFFGTQGDMVYTLSDVSDRQLHILLTNWFFGQERKGLALITGLEALRDINTEAFMQYPFDRKYPERILRENSDSFFRYDVRSQLKDDLKNAVEHKTLINAAYNIAKQFGVYKDLRNAYAHSLTEGKNSILSMNVEEIDKALLNFKKNLNILNREIEREEEWKYYVKYFKHSKEVISEMKERAEERKKKFSGGKNGRTVR